MRRSIVSGVLALAALGMGTVAIAASDEPELKEQHWHFKGPFGTYDRAAAQRGFQVYKEVCSACHSLTLLSYRNLEQLGLNEAQVKGVAAEFQVPDIGDDGSAIERPARPSDHFRKPFPNELAAAAANGGKAPPDLSVIIKAREGGPDYVYALLTGYVPFDKLKPEQIKEFHVTKDDNFNLYFPGHRIAMPPPLADGKVTLCRRHQEHARPAGARRRRVPRLGVGAAPRGAQPHGHPRDPVPARPGRPDVRRETAGLGRQALIGLEHQDLKTKKPRNTAAFLLSGSLSLISRCGG